MGVTEDINEDNETKTPAQELTLDKNKTYCGYCITGKHGIQLTRESLRKTITAIGLESLLPYACPPSMEDVTSNKEYYSEKYFTKKALTNARQISQKFVTNFHVNKPQSCHRIVVHIRRGDVTEATYPNRYLPNRYYLKQIEKYRRKCENGIYSDVVIFSESTPTDPFDAFYYMDYDVRLDASIEDVWTTAINCDVFIMSKSSFSYIPALLTRATTVVYPRGFWHKKLENWVIGEEIIFSKLEVPYIAQREVDGKQIQIKDNCTFSNVSLEDQWNIDSCAMVPLQNNLRTQLLFDMLVDTYQILTKHTHNGTILPSLRGGTLLGAIRSEDILPFTNDNDIDVSSGVWKKLQQKDAALRADFFAAGYVFFWWMGIRICPHTNHKKIKAFGSMGSCNVPYSPEWSEKLPEAYTDIYHSYDRNNNRVNDFQSCTTNNSDYLPLKKVKMRGHDFLVPRKVKLVLCKKWGNDWRIPIKVGTMNPCVTPCTIQTNNMTVII